ncbi:MAG: hypothetical protein B7Y86_03495 [Brevundimonas subvibrioides]|jgi:hypothetical protein|uniref:Translation initiation factor IF-2 n=1 Tax=Brevundimonas subvibrioides TaxID=74313 RepID=A0A258HMI6_9CAUL|nr:hypothetical protein [Brevundimonas subvibrioides]OYX58086.1 MAG: hypothetical protein B7Y86_03495 [Brevundimonas subvibrioides]
MSFLSLPLFLLIGVLSSSPQTEAPASPPAEVAPATEAATAPNAGPEEVAAPVSPEEAAFNERSAALGQRVLAVDAQMKDTARLTALNPDAAKAELDAIQTGFQAEIDAFIQDFFNLAAQKFATLPEAEQQTLRTNVENTAGQLATLPQAMRDRAEAAALLPPPPEAAPSH